MGPVYEKMRTEHDFMWRSHPASLSANLSVSHDSESAFIDRKVVINATSNHKSPHFLFTRTNLPRDSEPRP